jgi:hypothetical protein
VIFLGGDCFSSINIFLKKNMRGKIAVGML